MTDVKKHPETPDFLWVLLAVICAILLDAVMADTGVFHFIQGIPIVLVIISVIKKGHLKKLEVIVLLSMIFINVIIQCVNPNGENYALNLLNAFIRSMLLIRLTIIVLVNLLNLHKISLNELLGAFAAFIMISLSWAGLYSIIYSLDPNAFYYAPLETYSHINVPALIYFSFTTITTLGYGDILAISPLAKTLSMLEAVSGVFYIAVILGRFMQVFSSSSSHNRSNNIRGEEYLSLRAFLNQWINHPFAFVLITILIYLFALPYIQTFQHKSLVYSLLFMPIILSAFIVQRSTKKIFYPIPILLGVGVLSELLLVAADNTVIKTLIESNHIILSLLTLWFIFKGILQAERVNFNVILGALTGYLLIGIFCSQIYSLAYFFSSKTFYSSALHTNLNIADFNFFSFITLTTVGYGDIIPVSPILRVVTSLEAVMGVLYIGTLISRYIGTYTSTSAIAD